MSINIGEILLNLWNDSGFAAIISGFMTSGGWQNLVMLAISCVLLYLAIVKKFEPLLLCGIAFGCLLSNLPGAGLYNQELWTNFMDATHENYHSFGAILREGGLLDFFYIGVKTSIYPCLIFMGVGAMTDFGPLLSNPKSLLLGAAAQMGVFAAYFGARLLGFSDPEAASIGIIGGADGPTAIFLTSQLAPHLLGGIAVAAYSYMALIPMIQPPFMKLLTTPEQRKIKMVQTRTVSKAEKIIFPIVVTLFVALLLPDTAALIGCLMLGNLFKETGCTDRLSLGDGTGLDHLDLALLGGGHGVHDGGLDQGDQRHVGVSGHGDGAQQVGSQLGGQEDGGGAVSAADDADGSSLGAGEAQQDAAEESHEYAQLRGSAQQQALGVAEQRTEVGHGTNTHEDQAGVDAGLNADVEEVQQTAIPENGAVAVIVGTVGIHKRGPQVIVVKTGAGQVGQQTAEGDAAQQQRLELFDNSQIQQNAGQAQHDQILPAALGQEPGEDGGKAAAIPKSQ